MRDRSAGPESESIHARLSGLRGRGLAGADLAGEAALVAADLQRLALRGAPPAEVRAQARLARLVRDADGLRFSVALTDRIARARSPARAASQVCQLLDRYGPPRTLSRLDRLALRAFRMLGPALPHLLVPAVRARIRRELRALVLPGDDPDLGRALRRRVREGVRVNLNPLGEWILGEREAEARLARYLAAIARPEVECVSVKVSSIGSQLEVLARESVLGVLADRLRRLHRRAAEVPHVRPDGRRVPKLVTLDMEEYAELDLTLELFRRVLDEPEFLGRPAGIVLQAYLPDSHPAQRELVAWARERVERGGAPIRIRIVKGANLAMERCEAAERGWPQAPYRSKAEVDANYKRMLLFGVRRENAEAAHLGVATHNVFDLALGLVARALADSEDRVGFELLEGMAAPVRRALQSVTGDVLVYCPAIARAELRSAVAYLIRRFDENAGPENFLRVGFGLAPGSEGWRREQGRFRDACARRDEVTQGARRTQDRRSPPARPPADAPFENEPQTDFSLPHNREWIASRVAPSRRCETRDLPCQVGGEEVFAAPGGWHEGRDPSQPGRVLYRAALADELLAERALAAAAGAARAWGRRSVAERSRVLAAIAQELRRARGDLIGAMLADAGKAIREADAEVSEAVDFAEYYRRSLEAFLGPADLELEPRGVVVVAPPWNFPLAIPAGGVLAALMAGNAVVLKPAPETLLVAWLLADLVWRAGVPRDVLQFLPCRDEPVGSQLVRDARVAAVVLTGSTATARHLLRLRPRRPLLAETGGKNGLVVTSLADRDLAIRDAVRSAFGHAGQKCSAASLLVCEAEVHDDAGFRERLRDAAKSLHVGSAWDPRSVVTPLIRPPEGNLRRALTRLESGESWLLEPRADAENPALWSPGIKLGVAEGGFSHTTELFGPVLSLMRARDLEHAIAIVNSTPYGLTAALHDLDEREQRRFVEAIDVGNAYLNRGTTGAIVGRQPFGGRKTSVFGPGAKAGGPNYVLQLSHVRQRRPPARRERPSDALLALLPLLARPLGGDAERDALSAAVESYAAAWNGHFALEHDPARLLGQDNRFRYQPVPRMVLRAGRGAGPLELSCALAAAGTCGITLRLSVSEDDAPGCAYLRALGKWPHAIESEGALAARLAGDGVGRIRCLGEVGDALVESAGLAGVHCEASPVLHSGRVELLRYLREQVISADYHRHGNLGDRDDEARAAVR